MPLIDKIFEFPEKYDPIKMSPAKAAWWISPAADIATSLTNEAEINPTNTESIHPKRYGSGRFEPRSILDTISAEEAWRESRM